MTKTEQAALRLQAEIHRALAGRHLLAASMLETSASIGLWSNAVRNLPIEVLDEIRREDREETVVALVAETPENWLDVQLTPADLDRIEALARAASAEGPQREIGVTAEEWALLEAIGLFGDGLAPLLALVAAARKGLPPPPPRPNIVCSKCGKEDPFRDEEVEELYGATPGQQCHLVDLNEGARYGDSQFVLCGPIVDTNRDDASDGRAGDLDEYSARQRAEAEGEREGQ